MRFWQSTDKGRLGFVRPPWGLTRGFQVMGSTEDSNSGKEGNTFWKWNPHIRSLIRKLIRAGICFVPGGLQHHEQGPPHWRCSVSIGLERLMGWRNPGWLPDSQPNITDPMMVPASKMRVSGGEAGLLRKVHPGTVSLGKRQWDCRAPGRLMLGNRPDFWFSGLLPMKDLEEPRSWRGEGSVLLGLKKQTNSRVVSSEGQEGRTQLLRYPQWEFCCPLRSGYPQPISQGRGGGRRCNKWF